MSDIDDFKARLDRFALVALQDKGPLLGWVLFSHEDALRVEVLFTPYSAVIVGVGPTFPGHITLPRFLDAPDDEILQAFRALGSVLPDVRAAFREKFNAAYVLAPDGSTPMRRPDVSLFQLVP